MNHAISARLGCINLIDGKVPVVGGQLPTPILLALASRRIREQRIGDLLLVPGAVHVPIRDLDARGPAPEPHIPSSSFAASSRSPCQSCPPVPIGALPCREFNHSDRAVG